MASDATRPPKKRLASCIPCRERHTKCGKQRPVCSSCSSAKHHRDCTYESKRPLRFRLTFSHPQNGDAAPDVRPGHSTAGSPIAPYQLSTSPWNSQAQSPETRTPSVFPAQQPSDPSPQDQQVQRETSGTPYAVTPCAIASEVAPGGSVSQSSQVPGRLRRWSSLSNRTECDIFAFYTRSLGRWLDIGSPNHYFQSRVPQLAMGDPLLFFACLSCSSEIMTLRGELDKSVEEHYRAKVLEILIPLLSSHDTTMLNEPLLATTVILRMSEQFLELENDTRRHLHGAASLFNADTSCWTLREVNLATASFWTHLRESIRVAFLHEQPCEIHLQSLVSYEALSTEGEVPDDVWTNLMTYLLLQTIQLCWGEPKLPSDFRRLADKIDEWESSVPQSFQPWCFAEEPNSPFPRILHFESWHVVAWQFFYVAKVMLSVYRQDPEPRGNILDLRHHIETSVVTPTRKLCGVCISSTDNIGNTLNGSHLMAWAGQFLHCQEEQQHLVTFLEGFSERTSWPTCRSLEKLKGRWESQKPSWPKLA